MADFRFRRAGEGLSVEDEARIRRYIQEENAKRAEINKKLPAEQRQRPSRSGQYQSSDLQLDEDRFVYSVATGDPKKRESLLNQLKELYPAPPIAQSGFPAVTATTPIPPIPTTPASASSTATTGESLLGGVAQPTDPGILGGLESGEFTQRVSPQGQIRQLEEKQAAAAVNKTFSTSDIQAHPEYIRLRKEGVGARQAFDQVKRQLEAGSLQEHKRFDPYYGLTAEQRRNNLRGNVAPSTATVPAQPTAQNAVPDTFREPAINEEITLSPLTNRVTHVDITKKPIRTNAPRTNPLMQYASYTYGLSLRALSISDFNSIVENTSAVVTKTENVLIASGGAKSKTTLQRAKEFNEDFFFDKLSMNTVIGLNSRGRGSNVIDINFTIIEPYGITFIERLLKVAKRLDIKRWDEMPFLLVIDFFGNTDAGELKKLHEHTKYLPIRILSNKIKLTSQGSEYQITAVPYSHQSFMESLAVTPINMEVTAELVKDFFDAKGDSGDLNALSSARERNEERAREIAKEETGEVRRLVIEDALKTGEREIEKSFIKVGSFSAAINKYQQTLKDKGLIEYPDNYSFNITEDDIRAATITNVKRNSVKNSPMANNSNQSITKALREQLGLANSTVVDTNTMVFPVNAGTNVIEVINQVLRNSSYITSQIKSTASQTTETDNPINWYKVVPKLKLGNYDTKRKTHQKLIEFRINKYSYYNTKYPYARKSNPSTWEKEYNYIFTGKNDSIIDLDIDFNTAFFVAIQSFRGKSSEATGPVLNSEGNPLPSDLSPAVADPNDAAQIRYNVQSGTNESRTTYDKVGDETLDLFKSVLTSVRGDMLNIQTKIIGDPEFIKQDDILYVPGQSTERVIDEFGSLVTDASEIFVYIRFRTPSDINQATGLMDFETWKNESSFSGIYRVLTVNSEFSRGQFVQTLQLARLHDQNAQASNNTPPDPRRENESPNGAENNTRQKESAASGNATAVETPPNATANSSDSATNRDSASVSGDKVTTPGPRIRPDEAAIDVSGEFKTKVKNAVSEIKSKISGAATSISEASFKLERSIFASDPNAPPYTGTDPIVRRRLGLPPLDTGEE